jgi:hypothetical protein
MATSKVLNEGEPPSVKTIAKEVKHSKNIVEEMLLSESLIAGNSIRINL